MADARFGASSSRSFSVLIIRIDLLDSSYRPERGVVIVFGVSLEVETESGSGAKIICRRFTPIHADEKNIIYDSVADGVPF